MSWKRLKAAERGAVPPEPARALIVISRVMIEQMPSAPVYWLSCIVATSGWQRGEAWSQRRSAAGDSWGDDGLLCSHQPKRGR